MKKYTIGIDIGGTNTDAVLVSEREIIFAVKKNTTRPIDRGFFDVLQSLLEETKISLHQIERICIGSTHAMNAILERNDLSRVGLLRIAGHHPTTLPPCSLWPQELKEALLVGHATIGGGFECDGRAITPFNPEEARLTIHRLLEKSMESLAIVSVFSTLNADHEKQVKALIQEIAGPSFPVSLSSEIGGLGLIERENSTLLNAALKKALSQGFFTLEKVAKDLGIKAPLYMVQNNGSLMELEEALDFPIRTLSAGPTNSFMGAAQLAHLHDAIVIDIGGTSTDIGLVKNGFAKRSFRGSTIGGVTLNFPMPDVISIALGGGSYVDLEKGTMGPKSCGRRLKEEALSFGGTQCTLTDLALSLFPSLIPGANCPALNCSPEKIKEMMIGAISTLQRECKKMAHREQDLPVILVGGGARLFAHLLPSSGYAIPLYAEVANAYGAALAQLSAVEEQVISLNEKEKALAEIIAICKQKVIAKGAKEESVVLIDLEVIPYHYMPDPLARVIATASGVAK